MTRNLSIPGSILVLVLGSSASAEISFSRTEYPANSIGNCAGDFNNDGKPDLVTLSPDHRLAYFEGAGDGTLMQLQETDIGALTTDIPSSIACAHFDADGILDVAIAYSLTIDRDRGESLSVHLGDGMGRFTEGLLMPTGIAPRGLAIGDFNLDGHSDLAVAAGGVGLWVHVGQGDGTFEPGLQRPLDPLTSSPQEVAAGNIDNSGGDDIVMLVDRDLVVLRDGGFTNATPQVIFNAVPEPFGQTKRLALGDLNNDGNLDVVVGSRALVLPLTLLGRADAYLGNGRGDLIFWSTVPGGMSTGLALADFNTDGNLDIVSDYPSVAPYFAQTLAGDGAGHFSGGASFVFFESIRLVGTLVVDDFNLDGRPDFVATIDASDRNDLLVFLNTSSRGCIDRVALEYSGHDRTLTLNFKVQNAVPSLWTTWIAWQSHSLRLWSYTIPAVTTLHSVRVPLGNVPPVGNVAVLTWMRSGAYGPTCGDFRFIDTGGVGPTARDLLSRLRSQALELQ